MADGEVVDVVVVVDVVDDVLFETAVEVTVTADELELVDSVVAAAVLVDVVLFDDTTLLLADTTLKFDVWLASEAAGAHSASPPTATRTPSHRRVVDV